MTDCDVVFVYAGLVMESVNRCDVDVRKELYGGVVLTGEIS